MLFLLKHTKTHTHKKNKNSEIEYISQKKQTQSFKNIKQKKKYIYNRKKKTPPPPTHKKKQHTTAPSKHPMGASAKVPLGNGLVFAWHCSTITCAKDFKATSG